ncbi:unnamed protein product [marine sediment metagenome]|uniref:Uncharacterized protein n=1 Tax=marine sediment metagenome TaxID=412755 RepID=X0YKF0_9ZZZZ
MNDEKIKFSEIEIAEIYTRWVRASGTGGVINFLKRFIGRKVFIIIPKPHYYQSKKEN